MGIDTTSCATVRGHLAGYLQVSIGHPLEALGIGLFFDPNPESPKAMFRPVSRLLSYANAEFFVTVNIVVVFFPRRLIKEPEADGR